MFKFKKALTAFCAVAMMLTSAISAYAVNDSYTFGLRYGEEESDDSCTYIVLTVDGFDGTDAYTGDGTIQYWVTKGVFSGLEYEKLGSNNKDGLYSPKAVNGSANTAPTFNLDLNTDASDEYDLFSITWSCKYTNMMTSTGDIVQICASYEDGPKDAVFIPRTDNPQKFYASATDSTGATVASSVTVSETSKTTSYKLLSDSDEIVVYDDEPTEVIPTATTTGKQNGVKIGDGYTGDTDATDMAAAVGVGVLGDGNVHNELLWEVTADIEGTSVTKTHKSTVSVDGDAAYKFGLVIQGLAQSAITAVTAVLQ